MYSQLNVSHCVSLEKWKSCPTKVFFFKVLITYSERMTTAMLVVVANVDTLVNLVDNVCTVM